VRVVVYVCVRECVGAHTRVCVCMCSYCARKTLCVYVITDYITPALTDALDIEMLGMCIGVSFTRVRLIAINSMIVVCLKYVLNCIANAVALNKLL
jgi:hypothetical protein